MAYSEVILITFVATRPNVAQLAPRNCGRTPTLLHVDERAQNEVGLLPHYFTLREREPASQFYFFQQLQLGQNHLHPAIEIRHPYGLCDSNQVAQ